MSRWFRMAVAAAATMFAAGEHGVRAIAVSLKTRAYFRALCRRWRRRHPGAHAGRCGLPAMGPGRRGRKPARARAGVVASQALVASPPDGYTLIVVASGHATNPFLYPKIPYDTFKDFTPISLLASSPNILLVKANSPFKTVADVIAQARAKPGSLAFAHAGNGTSTHLAGELLKNLAKIDINAIPYKGGAPAINDLLGGQIPMSFNNGPESVGQIAGRHASARSRSRPRRGRRSCPMCPAWPRPCRATTPRCGGDLLGPAGMPRDLVEKLSHDFVAALNTEAVKERLTKLGASPIGSSPQAVRCQDSCRLREMGADHQGRRHEGRMSRDDSRLSAAARRQPAESTAAAGRLRYACPCVRARGAVSLCRRPQLHAAGRAAGKISRHARSNRLCARRAGAGQRARPRQFRDARCAARNGRTVCAGVAVADADVAPAVLREWNRIGVRGLRFNHFFRDGQLHYRGGVPLTAARDARARDGRTRMASSALDRRQGPARDDSGPEIARPAGRDRSHGPHRCPRRHGNGRFPEPVARGRRRLVLGQAVGRPSPQPQRARLSRCAAVS